MVSTTIDAHPRYHRPEHAPPTSLGDHRGKIFWGLLLICCVGSTLRYSTTREFVTARLSPEMVAEAGDSTDAMISFGTIFGLGISSVCVLFVGLGIIHQLAKLVQSNPAMANFANVCIVATLLGMTVPQLLYVVHGTAHSGVIAGVIYALVVIAAALCARRRLRGLGWKLFLPAFLVTVLPFVFFGSLFVGVMS